MDETQVKALVQEVTLLRETVEKSDADSAENVEKIAKLEKSLDTREKVSEKIANELAAAQTKITELGDLQEELASGKAEATKTIEETKTRMAELEADIAKRSLRDPKDSKAYRDTEEGKAYEILVKHGVHSHEMTPEIKALLRTDNQVQGGFLTQIEYSREMIKFITEFSPMRPISSVRTTTEKAMNIPVRKTIGEAFFEGENEAAQEANSTYGTEEMHTYRLSAKTPITTDQLMNSAFDMDVEITSDTAEMFESKEGLKFVLGTSVKQPEGFLTNQTLIDAAFDTAASGVLDADAILEVQGELKRGQNPRFTLNRQTLAKTRTLKGSDGHYLWSPALDGSASNMLAGSPYTILQDMPVIAAGSLSIAYGDFVRGYRILDRTGMIMVRDEVTLADNASVKFVFHRWLNGQVINTEAIKILRIKA